jgi:DNA-binding GntR family transcriptional regulator
MLQNNVNADVFSVPQKVTFTYNVVNSVTKAISVGIFKPNERLTEQSISEKVGVSRAPIREALKILYTQGLLVKGATTGYRVASFDQKTVKNVITARQSIEAILLQSAVEEWKRTDPKVIALQKPISMMKSAAKTNDYFASIEADLAFHKTIAMAGKNEFAVTLWDTISRHVLVILSLNNFRWNNLNAVVDHHEKFRDLIITKLESGFTGADAHVAIENHFSDAWAN